MAEHSKIEWTDATWNPITGCSVVSPGCTHCYAMKLAGTRLAHHPSRSGLTKDTKAGPVWTGEVRLNDQWLDQPLRWRRPRRIFVCAHGDLFHESVPDAWLDKVFVVMAMARRHSFQVLTKRAERMRAYLSRFKPSPAWDGFVTRDGKVSNDCAGEPLFGPDDWPLPNVWLGVSAEDQQRADERTPHLLNTPAAVRFVSLEPLLGPIDLRRLCLVPKVPGSARAGIHIDALEGRYVESGVHYAGEWEVAGPPPPADTPALRLDWVIVGGESGPNARPMHPDWARSLRDQCQAAGVQFFFKQWGEWVPVPPRGDLPGNLVLVREGDISMLPDGTYFQAAPGHLSFPEPYEAEGCIMRRLGKKRAGRQLDGRTWDEMPETNPP